MEYIPFPKIPRLSRNIVVTEKIDGTNACVAISCAPDGFQSPLNDFDFRIPKGGMEWNVRFGSRTRWLSLASDNYGFCRWGRDNLYDLIELGVGNHFGEWWGSGIQRGYGLQEKRFSLFNAGRFVEAGVIADAPPCFALKDGMAVAPACCHVVPVMYQGPFVQDEIEACLSALEFDGSKAAPGYDNPEGIIIYHTAAGSYFKKTIEKDEQWKGKEAA